MDSAKCELSMPLPRMIPSRNLPPRCWLLAAAGVGWGGVTSGSYVMCVCVCLCISSSSYIFFDLFFFLALQNKEGKGTHGGGTPRIFVLLSMRLPPPRC